MGPLEGVLVDVSEIPQDVRRRLLEAAHRKGLKPKQLGVSYSVICIR